MRPQTQLCRCFIEPIEEPPKKKRGGNQHRRTWRDEIPAEMIELLRPWAHPYLVWDPETTVDAKSGQRARVLFWQERGLRYDYRCAAFAEGLLTQEAMDKCWREGVAYNPLTCTKEDIHRIKDYAAKHGLCCMEMQNFITRIFYRQTRLNARIPEPKLIINHNGPFDIGSVSNRTKKSCDEDMYGALSLGLCTCRENQSERGEREQSHGAPKEASEAVLQRGKYNDCWHHPNIKIRKIGAGKHITKCGFKYDGVDKYGKPKFTDMCLEFLDTRTLARAELGPGEMSLDALCRMFKTATQKGTVEGHGGEIDETYLDYARTDVQCTWELFVELRELYKRHGLTKRITDVYSEASIGKGYFGDLGVQSFFGFDRKTKRNTRNLQFDPKVLGIAMEGYFGGKSMAQIRHLIMECMHGDFRSQYPSVNALMRLQELLLAIWVEVVRGADTEAKRWLEAVTLADFQRPETWPKLRGFARIRISNDGLPFRCEYEPADDVDDAEETCEVKSINVGINQIRSACDGWFSFADICASKFLTGKCPEILETIEFVPHGQQTTKIIKIFGDPNYTVDLSKDDFFVKVIELRTTVKAHRKRHAKGSPEYARLDAIQLALKLIANATSYGILVEVVVDERKAEVPCMVYHGGEATRRVARKKSDIDDGKGFKSERPGKYFAPFGGLIPAAGRLLLAIAEVLFRDGLSYMFCDTDSMCPARPATMSREEFRKRVMEVIGPNGRFQPLSPYSDGEDLFALEDVNYKLLDDESGEVDKSQLEPLYCWVISAKRYVLFNIGKRGETIIRKISGHGLGDLRRIENYDPALALLTKREHVAAPLNTETGKRKYGDLAHGSNPRLLCDLWRIAVDCARKGETNKIDGIIAKRPQLQVPQYSQIALSSTHLFDLYPNLPERRGFQFFASFPAPRGPLHKEVPFDEHKALRETTLYASVPKGGVDAALLEEWKTTKTGLYRKDNNEFPHGLFDPAWKLRLQTVADRLQGYFDHPEPKSNGKVGELTRKVVVSLDKHYIGKETSPLDDDNELLQDDEPITTSSDLVLRSPDRNLQPVIDAEIPFRQGKRLTFAEMRQLKKDVVLHADGTLTARRLTCEECLARDVPGWLTRNKAWKNLRRFGRFDEVAAASGIPVTDIDYAARWGNHNDFRCDEFDWDAILKATDDVSGITAKRDRVAAERRKLAYQASNCRGRQKASRLLSELRLAVRKSTPDLRQMLLSHLAGGVDGGGASCSLLRL